MHLRTHFDIDQDGETLVWAFTRIDHEGHPVKGPDTGAIYFTRGEELRIQVSGGSETVPFEGFEILDCTVITRPKVYECGPGAKTVYAAPSPFVQPDGKDPLTAVIDIPVAQFVPGPEPVGEGKRFVKHWSGSLLAGQMRARWELSFVLTVAIQRDKNTTETRVFCFDPETVVGSGINPP